MGWWPSFTCERCNRTNTDGWICNNCVPGELFNSQESNRKASLHAYDKVNDVPESSTYNTLTKPLVCSTRTSINNTIETSSSGGLIRSHHAPSHHGDTRGEPYTLQAPIGHSNGNGRSMFPRQSNAEARLLEQPIPFTNPHLKNTENEIRELEARIEYLETRPGAGNKLRSLISLLDFQKSNYRRMTVNGIHTVKDAKRSHRA